MTVPNQLLINLSILFSKPTGIGSYTKNLFPYLKSLRPTLLTAENYSDFNCYTVPNNLTPADGTKGHLRRLIWTQFQLPKIYKELKSPSGNYIEDFRLLSSTPYFFKLLEMILKGRIE